MCQEKQKLTVKFENAETELRLLMSNIAEQRGKLFNKFIDNKITALDVQKIIKANRCLKEALEALKK